MPGSSATGPLEAAVIEQLEVLVRDLEASSARIERTLRALASSIGEPRGRSQPERDVNHETSGPGRVAGQRPGQRAAAGREQNVRLRVERASVEQLLDFQEQLSLLPGVRGVSISATGQQGASLLVHLGGDNGERTDDEGSGGGEESPTVVCVMCGRVVARGSEAISHGLCPECTENYLRGQVET